MSNLKEQLIANWKEGIENKAKYFYVSVFMEGFPTTELIVNIIDNVEGKLKYYDKTYNEDLLHKFAKNIGIVDFGYCHDLSELEHVKKD